jgi:hypothetical protein
MKQSYKYQRQGKQSTDEAILQIPLSLCLTSHDEVTNPDKKTISGLPSGK